MVGVDRPRVTLAANLRRHRLVVGLSQEELAHAANLHPNAIGLIEREERDPRLSTLRALARALDAHGEQTVTVADLVTGID